MQICFYVDFKTSVLLYLFVLVSFLKSTSLSSLYKPVDFSSSLFDNKDSIWMPTCSQILAPSKLPMVTPKQLSVVFFSKVHYYCTIRIYYNALLYAIVFLEFQCIAGQTGSYYLIFLLI